MKRSRHLGFWFSCFFCVAAAPVDLGPGKQPQATISAAGDVLVVFGRDNSIFFTKSTDAGKTFDAPALVAGVKAMPLGMRRGPRIVATRDSIVITAIAGQRGAGADGDVLLWRSTDAGRTWSAPRQVNDVPAAAREGLMGLASDGGSRVFCTWLDLRSNQTELYGALSSDGGQTFGENVRVYRSPDGHVCECCHPSAAIDPTGGVHVMFRNWLEGNRDMYVASSIDNGRAFGPAVKLGEGSWKLNACPMDGGGLIAGVEAGTVQTVWRREGQVYFSQLTGREQLLGPGVQPVITLARGAACMAWVDPRGRLMLRAGPSPPRAIAEKAVDPVLAGGADTPAVCLWESSGHCFASVVGP